MIHIHYAVQVCDKKSYQSKPRICGDDRTILSKKSIVSLCNSIQYCVDLLPNYVHNVNLIYDDVTEELFKFIIRINEKFSNSNINFVISKVSSPGFPESIGDCYSWLKNEGKDFVFQIQDDYLFSSSSMYETIGIYNKIYQETGSESIVSPYNDSWNWDAVYRNRPTPRAVFNGEHRYWIQYYDMSCSFFTSHNQFIQHFDLYNKFLQLIPEVLNTGEGLESKSLNHILVKRGVLGIIPIPSLSFHIQTELEEDPHQDWKKLWDSVNVDLE